MGICMCVCGTAGTLLKGCLNKKIFEQRSNFFFAIDVHANEEKCMRKEAYLKEIAGKGDRERKTVRER